MRGDRFGSGLADVQATLYDLITAPEGVAKRLDELRRKPADLESIVKPSARETAVERLDVYANMYFYRFLDVLRDEYAKVLAVLGDAAFHNLVTAYLIACRPAHPSLGEAGARLPGFIAGDRLTEDRPWTAELARLERAHLELFDGPDAVVLTVDELRTRTPGAFPALFLHAIPCHTVLKNRFNISGAWKALASGESTDMVPETCETLLVWRQGFDVFHRVVDDDEGPLLSLIEAGARFEVVCARLLEQVPEDQGALRAFEIIGRWVTEGLVAAPE